MTDTERLTGLASGDAENMSLGGRYSPNKVRRAALLRDSARLAAGDLGLSKQEKRQYMGETGQQIGAALEAQSQDIGQMTLAAGPRDAGRLQKMQRQIGQEGIAQGMAQASADVERLSQAKATAEKATIEAALERQQQLDWQRQQYYTNLAKDVGGSIMREGPGSAEGAKKMFSLVTGIMGLGG